MTKRLLVGVVLLGLLLALAPTATMQDPPPKTHLLSISTIADLAPLVRLDEDDLLSNASGDHIAHAGGSTLYLHNWTTGQTQTVAGEETVDILSSLALHPADSRIMLAGYLDYPLHHLDFIDTTTGETLTTFPTTTADYPLYFLSPDGERVVLHTEQDDQVIVQLWDWRTGEVVHTLNPEVRYELVYFDDVAGWLVALDDMGNLQFFDPTTYELVYEFADGRGGLPTFVDDTHFYYFTNDYGDDGLFHITFTEGAFDGSERTLELEPVANSEGYNVFLSDDGRSVLELVLNYTYTAAESFIVWDAATGARLLETEQQFFDRIGVALYQDSDGSLVEFFSGQTFPPLQTTDSEWILTGVTADVRWASTLNGDNAVAVWDLATGQQVLEIAPYLPYTAGGSWVVNDMLLTWEENRVSFWAIEDHPDLGIQAGQAVRSIDTARTISDIYSLSDDQLLVIAYADSDEIWYVPQRPVVGGPDAPSDEGGEPSADATPAPANDTPAALAETVIPGEVVRLATFANVRYPRPTSEDTTFCTMMPGDAVLVVASGFVDDDLAAGYFLGYTASCEGLVWMNMHEVTLLGPDDAEVPILSIVWEDATPTYPIATLPGYEDICTNATAGGSRPSGQPPYSAFFATRHSLRADMPSTYRATSVFEVDVVVCLDYGQQIIVGGCRYTDGSTRETVRPDVLVRLVNYETGRIFQETRVQGHNAPTSCPQTTAGPFIGDSPTTEEVSVAVVAQLDRLNGAAGGLTPNTLTTIAVETMNARSEPSTTAEILSRLPLGTHVSLIARNSAGDWVVGLTPDMQQVWLFRELLSIATGTDVDALPIYDGVAGAAPLPARP